MRYCGIKFEFARFYTPQINAVTTSYLYVLSPTLTLAGFGVFDASKLQLFPDIERKKILPAKKPAGIRMKKLLYCFF